MNVNGEWEFYRVPGFSSGSARLDWSWRFHCDDGTVKSTPQTFRFILACAADARLHGYTGEHVLTQPDNPYIQATRRPSPDMRAAALHT